MPTNPWPQISQDKLLKCHKDTCNVMFQWPCNRAHTTKFTHAVNNYSAKWKINQVTISCTKFSLKLHPACWTVRFCQSTDCFYCANACNATHSIAEAFLYVRPTCSLWQNERNCAHILIPHERSFILVFWQEEWLVWDDTFCLKFRA